MHSNVIIISCVRILFQNGNIIHPLVYFPTRFQHERPPSLHAAPKDSFRLCKPAGLHFNPGCKAARKRRAGDVPRMRVAPRSVPLHTLIIRSLVRIKSNQQARARSGIHYFHSLFIVLLFYRDSHIRFGFFARMKQLIIRVFCKIWLPREYFC